MTQESSKSTMKIIRPSGNDLYHRYPGQISAQDAYVELDCEREILYADCNSEIGNAVPMDVYHGRSLRWGIPALRGPAASDLLDAIAPLAERVIDGYDTRGANNVAVFDSDAREAIDEITALCEVDDDDSNTIRAITADDYFEYVKPTEITARTTDEELKGLAEKYELDAFNNDVDEIDGLPEYLERYRDEKRENEEE